MCLIYTMAKKALSFIYKCDHDNGYGNNGCGCDIAILDVSQKLFYQDYISQFGRVLSRMATSLYVLVWQLPLRRGDACITWAPGRRKNGKQWLLHTFLSILSYVVEERGGEKKRSAVVNGRYWSTMDGPDNGRGMLHMHL